MKKDILFLCQFFYPEHNSSATLPFDTAKYLASKGYNVGALCGYPKEYSDAGEVPLKEQVEGVDIERLHYVQLKRANTLGRLINYFSFTFKAFLHLWKLKDYKSVIVYSNPPVLPFVPVVANILFGTKIVFVAYDVYPEVAYASNSLRKGSIIDKGMRFINHLMYKRVSKVIALTDEMKNFLLSNRSELSEDRVTTIANWAHEKKNLPDEDAYARFGYENGQFVVSYFGNMGICQDMETLMGAAEILKDDSRVNFLLVGHGNKKDAIRQRIKDNNLINVQELDFLTGKAFEQAVAISSCCVVSLEKGLKGTCAPSKYYSYLQGGQPVLAVVEKGSYLEKEVNREKIGCAVEVGNSKDLADKILFMLNHSDECKEAGERAELLYENMYAYGVAMNRYEDVIKKVVE